jgi:hypothetical protein
MKKVSILVVLIFVGTFFLPFCSTEDIEEEIIETPWNTFLGSDENDLGYAIARDSSGNIYVTGYSVASWGSPLNAYSGSWEVFVACLDSSGNLLWNTFLGCPNKDIGLDIALDGSGKIYVTGYSETTWGTPVNVHRSGSMDGFIACLNSSGNLLWNTFFGSGGIDSGYGIVLDSSGSIYVVGYGYGTWGTPVNSYKGSSDAFVAHLDSSGQLLWNTFLGSDIQDIGIEIALDGSGKIYVTGDSYATWGSPVNAYSGDNDVFVACLNNSGQLLWNTFLGSALEDQTRSITLASSGNIYVTGIDNANSGSDNAFVACLTSSGNLLWNTLLGSSVRDHGYSITLDDSGKIYVSGYSEATWGSPGDAFNGGGDAFAACLDNSGNLLWNTFLGSAGFDEGSDIVVDSLGNFYVIGHSNAGWGTPVNAHSGAFDIFVAKRR